MVCHTCSSCAVGLSVLYPCIDFWDVVCVCATGEFSLGGICTPCSVCSIGQYIVGECWAYKDITCADCTNPTAQTPFLGTYTGVGLYYPTTCPWVCSLGYVAGPPAGQACYPCVANTWCQNGLVKQCPLNSNTDSMGSAFQSDCKCNVGYWGNGSWSRSIPLVVGQIEPPANWSGVNCNPCSIW
jgi:hypothetical protein